jgi:beta-galactosidase
MPSVSYNGQSFLLDGRRLWILAASLQYARIPPERWADRIADARQAGFNTIETACPWFLHEPRKGRYAFTNGADVKRFVTLCAEAQMRVILRPGPFVGAGFDGGGLPAWLMENPAMALRQANEPFLERVSRYFRKLVGELGPLQATKDGPIILVQVEHDWTCANDEQAEGYLREIARIIRECGMAVPLINANNLWQDPVGTIDTWRGDEDLLVNLRQLRTVQPDAPRLVRAFEPTALVGWGTRPGDDREPETILRKIAEVLAAGAQPIVSPFHAGTNFDFAGGRLPGLDGPGVTTSAASRPPLGEAGARGDSYRHIRRIVTFANHFSHVFSDLDPDYQPVALDPAAVREGATGRTRSRRAGLSLVPLRGAGGRVVFAFGDGSTTASTLLLDSGIRLPIELGSQPVGWYVIDADLQGRGRLDYANLCPFAIVDRGLLVLFGAPGADAFLSVSGTPLETAVPTGKKPLVVEHKDVAIVICNTQQIDAAYHDDEALYVGVDGFDAAGEPRPASGWTKAWRIARDGTMKAVTASGGAPRRTQRSITLRDWEASSAEAYATGASPRYATLSGPQPLTACGAATGYGWYRARLKTTSTKKRLVHAPLAGDRLHLFVDGTAIGVRGDGPGAASGPWEMSLAKGGHDVVILADNLGRFATGDELARQVGVFGHLYEVKPMRAVKPKAGPAAPVDPFEVRAFIRGGTRGQPSDTAQVTWTFAHARRTPILVEIDGAAAAGAFVLNDHPIAYVAGAAGAQRVRLLLDPGDPAFKRGRNVLRFAPNVGQPDAVKDISKHTMLYECTAAITSDAEWGFAKWEPPASSSFAAAAPAQAAKLRGRPCWWRCSFTPAAGVAPLWFNTAGLSKGQLYVNGRNLGRYFTSTSTGRAVGPQQRLHVPDVWLTPDEPNEILVFDEHGFAPHKTKLEARDKGDLD